MKKINIDISFDNAKAFDIGNYMAFGYANSDFTYTDATRRMYKYLSSYHVDRRYMRVHNILTCHGKGDYYLEAHGKTYGNIRDHRDERQDHFTDQVVSRDENGNLVYDWTIVDKVYDIMVDHGFIPIVETIFMPSVMRKNNTNLYLPEDYNEWYDLIKSFVEHLVDRYGFDEISKWYFEVWNEPDGIPIWGDDLEDYNSFFALYDYMAAAVKSVSTVFKVGGPAVRQLDTGLALMEAFLKHCSDGINYYTGKIGSQIDFISVHCKGGGIEHGSPSMDIYMIGYMEKFHDMIKKYPKFVDLEYINDESDIIWSGDVGNEDISWMNFRNTHYFPGFVCKMVDAYQTRLVDKGMNISIVDSDNCHIQWERSLFSGNRSQLTPLFEYPSVDLIKKPAFNAYVLLSKLADKRGVSTSDYLDKHDYGYNFKFGCLPTISKDKMAIMTWHFEDSVEEGGREPVDFDLNIDQDVLKGKYVLAHYRIDAKHSNAYNAWLEMGKPKKPTIEQIKKLRNSQELELSEELSMIDLGAKLTFNVSVPHHGISLLYLTAYKTGEQETIDKVTVEQEIGASGNKQNLLYWKPSENDDLYKYNVYRKSVEDSEFVCINESMSLNTSLYVDMDVEDKDYDYYVEVVTYSQEVECELH